jgi:hypothetical protein
MLQDQILVKRPPKSQLTLQLSKSTFFNESYHSFYHSRCHKDRTCFSFTHVRPIYLDTRRTGDYDVGARTSFRCIVVFSSTFYPPSEMCNSTKQATISFFCGSCSWYSHCVLVISGADIEYGNRWHSRLRATRNQSYFCNVLDGCMTQLET